MYAQNEEEAAKLPPPEWPGDIRDPSAGCWREINSNINSTVFGPDHCRRPCVAGTRYCELHQPGKKALEAIPVGIYYSPGHDNFYRQVDHRGLGTEFYMRWKERRDEFPRSWEIRDHLLQHVAVVFAMSAEQALASWAEKRNVSVDDLKDWDVRTDGD